MILALSVIGFGFMCSLLLVVRQLCKVIESFEDREPEMVLRPDGDPWLAFEVDEYARKRRIGAWG